jgi:hypothetical protein
MPGLVYTLERTASTNDTERWVSTDAIIAIALAAKGQNGIHYEELTESSNSSPMIAVVFVDNDSMEAFNSRIEGALERYQVRIKKVQMSEGLQTPKPSVADAEEV